MELYVGISGTVPSVNQWETEMRGIKLPYQHKKGDPKSLLKLGVCEMKLYKIFFPKDHLDTVMSMVGVPAEREDYVTKRYSKVRTALKLFRKMFGLKKAPFPKEVVKHMQPMKGKAVSVVAIGTKEDLYNDDGIEMI